MKADRYAKDLFKKLDGLSCENVHLSSKHGRITIIHDDDYYLDRRTEPPRFEDYRAARCKKKIGDTLTFEDAWDTITQDELDYYLKLALKVPHEERYQIEKCEWTLHESSWYKRNNGKGGYDGYGCNDGVCIPECRYYPKYGRVEDEEVIEWHRKWVESYRQVNAIVDPPPLDHIRPDFEIRPSLI